MGIIDKIFGKTDEAAKVINAGQTFKLVSAYEPVFTDWRGEIYESMLVRAAIDARSRHISKLKVDFMGSAKPDLSRRLQKRPNPWDTWSQFLYRVNTIVDCTNNCLIVPVYDKDLNKIGIYPVLAQKAKMVTYKDELWVTYKFRNGITAACRFGECAVLRKFQFKSDFWGSDNIALDDTMDLIAIQKQSIKEAVKSTASYKFMARSNNFSKISDLEAMQGNFTEKNFGSEAKGRGGVLLFPNTFSDIKQVDMKPYIPDKDQMDLIDENVYSYFGVNKDILQNRAVGDAWTAFYEGAIEPFAIQFSETLTSAIYSEREIANGAMVATSTNRVQYMSFTDKKNYVEGGLDRGILMIDEAREVYNLPPLPDGAGQRFVARGEYYFIQEENPQEDTQDGDQE